MTLEELTLFFSWRWFKNEHRRRVAGACKRRYYENNKKRAPDRASLWNKINRARRNRNLRLLNSSKQATDLKWRLRKNIQTRLWFALRAGRSHSKNLEKKLGCTVLQFTAYIAAQFKPGWSWENWEKIWEIDHKVPCAVFDLTRPEEVERCFHFSNQRPLGIFENRSKGAKILA